MLSSANQEQVKNCSTCQAEYIENEGTKCLLTCWERKLEEEHKKIAQEIVNKYFPKEKFKLLFPRDTLRIWGWSNAVTKVITIPWLTLRSKKEFLDTLIHEIAHLIAYQKKFTLEVRKILERFYYLQQKRDLHFSLAEELWNYYLIHRQVIDNYRFERMISKGGHWCDPWHLEYLRIFEDLLVSSYAKYAYGCKPRSHGFDEQGMGEYDMSKAGRLNN